MAKRASSTVGKATVSKRIPVAVFGAGGRMGIKNMGMILQQADMDLMAAIERPEHALFGQDVGAVSGHNPMGVLLGDGLEQALRGAKVMVDFSSPKGTLSHLNASVRNGVALVIGTTGLAKGEIAKIHGCAKKIPVVLSGNFSLGINVLLGLARQAAAHLEGYDAELVEYHHNLKKDAPSGTALMLARQVATGKKLTLEKAMVCGREGLVGARRKDEIGIHAVRGGGIVGRHEVLLVSDHETITLGHLAHDREAFTSGVLKAVRFAAKAKPGLYSMLDVLGMN
ncbi:MAG: 4-hydroxy-tetrahydrodipicolinate reductase [Spirochaetes bacterium]|nr:4-hydroxy-tetrahydrodipicolinate reductase [Spirochaetota bacterium]